MNNLTPALARFARFAACCAGGLLALTACSLTTTTVPDGFTSACEGSELLLAKGFRPAQEVDFVGFRVETTMPRPAQASDPAGPSGAPCASPCGEQGE
jgi:hypothetical protein